MGSVTSDIRLVEARFGSSATISVRGGGVDTGVGNLTCLVEPELISIVGCGDVFPLASSYNDSSCCVAR